MNLSLGSWLTVLHPTIVDLMTEQKFDWLCVDLEHSPTSYLDLQNAISTIQLKGKKAFARVAQNTHYHLKFPLDAGVDGVIIPMVNSADEAKQAVLNCFYPPKGNRGVGLARAQKYGFAFEEHLQSNLKNLTVIVQIEHVNAVEQIETILDIEGIAGVFIGPYDLSGSMGIPGQFEHPHMKEAIKKVSNATIARKKILGAHIITPKYNKIDEYSNLGYNFIAFSIDTLFLGTAMREELTKLGR
ncbi:HpcH/HpaI aldolase family protein [Pigmentibacter ruber]|uniref:HpcH/HpaI aldolase family protein n=1 Tax=Pigmentibacter ruber TaxID=2683196 RepID=UPI00131D8C19|nr:aldolase/citrate lyase family protein [Pigmentibacter ruber]